MVKRLATYAALLLTVSMSGLIGAPAWAAGSPWGADYFPNVPLVNQDGKKVMFYDDLLKDKKVMIDFIFSLCDQGCPLDTANMVRVQKLLGSRVGTDIFMYSITLDPENDTPEKLKEYAKQYGAGPGWQFLTGTRADIDAIRDKLGQRSSKEEHANAVQVADMATGRWIRIPLATDPRYIVTEIQNALYPGWSVGKKLASFAHAPKPNVFGPGQVMFANRCAACHTFGKGDMLGPDLMGLTERRELNWIASYLTSPNEMRARKDPIALKLAKTHKVLMPNLNLTKKEVAEMMGYLVAKSVAPAKGEAAKQPLLTADASGAAKSGAMDHDHAQHDHSKHDHAQHGHAQHDQARQDHAQQHDHAQHDHAQHDHGSAQK
ncbi:MAG: SCO family protein [Burkholderiales bacterium]|nr:SCO family protein [Burkholderiales bacterium]